MIRITNIILQVKTSIAELKILNLPGGASPQNNIINHQSYLPCIVGLALLIYWHTLMVKCDIDSDTE